MNKIFHKNVDNRKKKLNTAKEKESDKAILNKISNKKSDKKIFQEK